MPGYGGIGRAVAIYWQLRMSRRLLRSAHPEPPVGCGGGADARSRVLAWCRCAAGRVLIVVWLADLATYLAGCP